MRLRRRNAARRLGTAGMAVVALWLPAMPYGVPAFANDSANTGGVLDCVPESEQSPTGTPHTVTCTARDSSDNVVPGTEIDFEITGANDLDGNGDLTSPDVTCTTSSTGSCAFTHGGGGNSGSSDAVGVSTYRAWIDADFANGTVEADATESRDETATGAGGTTDPDATDVVEKTWVTQAASLTLTPAEPFIEVGSEQRLTATVTDTNGDPMQGAPVSWAMLGVGRIGESDSTTDADGVAEASIFSDEEGTQVVAASTTPCADDEGCHDGTTAHWVPVSADPCTIMGTEEGERLTGTNGDDVICGLGGGDTIKGEGGDDLILGGSGVDRIGGNGGRDVVRGGARRDILVGGSGNDVVKGGRGNDRLDGGRGSDRCDGGPGRNAERRCER